MRTAEKVIKTKVSLLELGKQLGNVTKASRVMGYSRDSFFDSKNFTTEVERQRCKHLAEDDKLLIDSFAHGPADHRSEI